MGGELRQEETPNNSRPWIENCDRILTKFWPDVIKGKEDFIRWFMSKESIGWLFDDFMVARLYVLYREKLDKNNDVVVIIVGREGSGKSTFATQLAAWIDPTLNNDHICLSRKEILGAWHTSKPKQAFITDEGGFLLFSRNAMVPKNKTLIQAFMILRQFQLFNIICCPSYKSIDSQVRNERVHLLIDVRGRGSYQAYFGFALDKVNRDLIKVKKLAYIRVEMKHSWIGNFNRFMPRVIDVPAYLEKKRAHGIGFLGDLLKEENKKANKEEETNGNIGVIDPHGVESEGLGGSIKPYLGTMSGGLQHLQLINRTMNGTRTKQ